MLTGVEISQIKKSTFSYMFHFLEAPISWCYKKQPVVALSTCEAEYIEDLFVACQAICLNSLIGDRIEDQVEEAYKDVCR